MTPPISIDIKWEPPGSGVTKLNTYGSTSVNLGPEGLCGVFRNHNGDWLLGFYQHIPHTTPKMAELLALRRGLIIAKTNNIKPLTIKTGTNAIIHMLANDHPLYHNIIDDCKKLLAELETNP